MNILDKTTYKARNIMGKAEEALGKAIGNDGLKNRGKSDQAKSSAKTVLADVQQSVSDAEDTLTGK